MRGIPTVEAVEIQVLREQIYDPLTIALVEPVRSIKSTDR